MKTKWIDLTIVIFLVVILLVATSNQVTYAVGPYSRTAITYTDLNNPSESHGSDEVALIFASNLVDCVPTTYVWMKFQLPDTTTTIGSAALSIPLLSTTGVGDMDLELRTVADGDFGWDPLTLTWGTPQPSLTSEVLSTVVNPGPGTDAYFQGDALDEFLDNHRGEEVTLVVKASCSPSTSPMAVRVISMVEETGVEGIQLFLWEGENGTAIILNGLDASNALENSAWMNGVIMVLSLLWVALVLVRNKRYSGK